MKVVPVIMCGGGGTRLWPASRSNYPKPFTPLIGDKTTFNLTVNRIKSASLFEPPIVIANEEHRFLVADELERLGVKGATTIAEPEARDTAAAVTAAAALVAQRDRDAVMLVLAADHLVDDAVAFALTCRDALPAAQAGRIVTFGINPTEPATGYGYIKPETTGEGVHKVAAFREKPDMKTATAYLMSGYLWNSGNFLMKASTLLEEMARFEPELARDVQQAVETGKTTPGCLHLDPEAFGKARRISIDYAVMEKSTLVDVVKANYQWSDVGNWNAIWGVANRDEAGNAFTGNVETVDVQNTLVDSQNVLTALVGVENLIVIATKDAVLVADRSRAEEVKKLVDKLKANRPDIVASHKQVARPWGHYETLELGPRHQVKRIVVSPGAKLSLQSHKYRAEHWTVVTGEAVVQLDEKRLTIGENEGVYIPLGAVHRIENATKKPVTLIEVQCGSYLGEGRHRAIRGYLRAGVSAPVSSHARR